MRRNPSTVGFIYHFKESNFISAGFGIGPGIKHVRTVTNLTTLEKENGESEWHIEGEQ